jgi:hypothetical protein
MFPKDESRNISKLGVAARHLTELERLRVGVAAELSIQSGREIMNIFRSSIFAPRYDKKDWQHWLLGSDNLKETHTG